MVSLSYRLFSSLSERPENVESPVTLEEIAAFTALTRSPPWSRDRVTDSVMGLYTRVSNPSSYSIIYDSTGKGRLAAGSIATAL